MPAPLPTAIDTRDDQAPRPRWLDPVSYPFDIHRVPVGDHDVAYIDVGNGPVLLFVHVGTWSLVWRDVVLRLRDDFRCVAIDAPATGLSGGRPRSDANLAHASDAVDAVVGALGLDALTLVVHDLGGPASLLAASRWPEKVKGIVAVNTFGWKPSGLLLRMMLAVMGSAAMRVSDAATGWFARLSSTRFGVGRHLSAGDRRVFRAGMDRRGRESFHHYIRSARPGRTDYDAVASAVEALKRRPVLTIFGARNDPGRFQAQWRERFAATTAAVVPKGYHFPMCDAPDLVADSIRAFAHGL